MNRVVIICLFVLLGFLMAFAHAAPKARAGAPVAMAAADIAGDVPLAWVARAISEMPFLLPMGR
jgi:di/tricarboxylate transporter